MSSPKAEERTLSKGCSCAIGPSILNADLSDLANECQRLIDADADYLHLDVMDGHFVPNLTFGHPVVKCLRPKLPDAYFEMHMMVSEPEKWVEPMFDAGANMYTFHLEATDNPLACIRKIKETGMRAGMSIKPSTPVESLLPFVDHLDSVLIMTVNPGFGGQKFMSECMQKVEFLREKYGSLDIGVDGGVNLKTIQECADVGVNMVVSGSALVNSRSPQDDIGNMRRIINKGLERFKKSAE